MSKKNLFRVIDTSTGEVVDSGIGSKAVAKRKRNQLNEKTGKTWAKDARPQFVVARGLDHPLGPSDGIDPEVW